MSSARGDAGVQASSQGVASSTDEEPNPRAVDAEANGKRLSLAPPEASPSPIRVVTASALFDGHDVSINVIRRILQASGAEVIHLGHNRSVDEIVQCAIAEDAHAVAITSYQGGHMELFRYLVDRLEAHGAKTLVFGGGGGTILPEEIEALHRYGVRRLYSPEDGRRLGLQGMVDDLLGHCAFSTVEPADVALVDELGVGAPQALARLISLAENDPASPQALNARLASRLEACESTVLGVTGTGGAGKSSLVDELVRRFLHDFEHETVAIVSIDPSRRRSGGALLGDRIRMNAIHSPRVFMRSLATRHERGSISRVLQDAIDLCKAAGFDLIIVETSGIGQSDTAIVDFCDLSLYVMTSDYGAATQLEKIDMLDFADVVALNKFDKLGSLDALRDVRRQVQRNRKLFDAELEAMPVVGTIASRFADSGTDRLYRMLMDRIEGLSAGHLRSRFEAPASEQPSSAIIADHRARYLAEIVETCRRYDGDALEQAALATELDRLSGAIESLRGSELTSEPLAEHALRDGDPPACAALLERYRERLSALRPESIRLLREWPALRERYQASELTYLEGAQEWRRPLVQESLAHLRIPRITLPAYRDWGELLLWLMQENVPGSFPFTAGAFPLKRDDEEPTRMFAGEGIAERTNRRFHFLSRGRTAKRLSTAFDSVTLYGADPSREPDVYGKIGNSGVSVATLDDVKRLYAGFNLCDPSTSVSMTINGPAPTVLAFFLNAAIDQQCELHLREQGRAEAVRASIEGRYRERGLEPPGYRLDVPAGSDHLGLLLLGATGDEMLPSETYERIRADALRHVRGTVQADILKEDQAQNTCIFSTEFALRLMGDVQAYFIEHAIRRFYTVSISGYHIAEAGANPITQLAFTLANAFTYVEHYLSRGMKIDDFAPSFSFFFSNGMDPEYAVIGRVARRIWAKTIRERYGGKRRSQRLKYHVQTSGRSLHAREIAFNDIRTTLEAFYALADHCNSLHTNAYDEAVTTPTEESVRRALAIQRILDEELGLLKSENPLQGSYLIAWLTDQVERAVLAELSAIDARGGVLGAMERMYQRSKIQEESMHYESLKHSGALPIVGVNTFIDSDNEASPALGAVIRSSDAEKEASIESLEVFHRFHAAAAEHELVRLREAAKPGENAFDALMRSAKVCSLGELSQALYEVGGRYRRAM